MSESQSMEETEWISVVKSIFDYRLAVLSLFNKLIIAGAKKTAAKIPQTKELSL